MGKKSWIILIFLMMFVLSDLGVLALSPSDEKPPEIIPLERLPQETSQIKALRKEIETYIEAYSSRMIEMNDWMYHNPEIGFKEFKASKMMGEELKKHGFDVKFGVDGLDENFNDFGCLLRQLLLQNRNPSKLLYLDPSSQKYGKPPKNYLQCREDFPKAELFFDQSGLHRRCPYFIPEF